MTAVPPINKSCRPDLSPADIHDLMLTAAGKKTAVRMITDVHVVNVHTGEIEEHRDVAIQGDRIAAVGPNLDFMTGPDTEIIPGRGRLVMPGMVDAHTHLDSIFTTRAFAPPALIGGNTTVVSETAMIAGAAGEAGVRAFIAEASGLPLRIFFLAPPLVPPFPDLETSAGMDFPAFERILSREDTVGVGETYWRPALDLDESVLQRFALARKLGKSLEGHAAGAHNLKLNAYRAGGVSSCHEATSSDEALARLALGMSVQIREGFIRCELPAMGPLAEKHIPDNRRIILCTDLASREMMLEKGIMNELIRRAVAVGFDPVEAVRMLTINPADHFGLRDLGRLDPGCLADLVMVDNLKDLNISTVMVGGDVVVENGNLMATIPDFAYPESMYQTFHISGVDPEDFMIPAPGDRAKLRVAAVVNETITKEEIVELHTAGGRVSADPERDLCKIAVFNKHVADRPASLGMAKGFGLREGAVATSLIWDTNNILCAGVTDSEMALAVNRLLENGGGMVVARGEQILAELPMPVAGIISPKPMAEIMAQSDAVEQAVRSLGSGLPRPFLTLQTFCFTGLPFLRLTDKGLMDVRRGCLVDLFFE